MPLGGWGRFETWWQRRDRERAEQSEAERQRAQERAARLAQDATATRLSQLQIDQPAILQHWQRLYGVQAQMVQADEAPRVQQDDAYEHIMALYRRVQEDLENRLLFGGGQWNMETRLKQEQPAMRLVARRRNIEIYFEEK
jgi:hypothetical protein